MDKIAIRTLMPGDVEFLATNLRAADRAELLAMNGKLNPYEAITKAVLASTQCYVAALPAEPVAIFGVAPLTLMGEVAAPWMLATEKAFKFGSVLVREGRRYAARMLEEYPVLMNYVDARNHKSVRWLKRIGFALHEPEPIGVKGTPFHRFEMRAQDVC